LSSRGYSKDEKGRSIRAWFEYPHHYSPPHPFDRLRKLREAHALFGKPQCDIITGLLLIT
jgi:hypothetical protein